MSFTVPQNLFINDPTVLTVVKCGDDTLSMTHLQPFLDAPSRILGVSAIYGKHCQLSYIAFSLLTRALVVHIPRRHLDFPRDDPKFHRVTKSRNLIQDQILLNPKFQKYAFRMDQVAVALHLELAIRISHAVDMISVTNDNRDSLLALMNAMGGEAYLQKKNVKLVFSKSSGSSRSPRPQLDPVARVALQAWAAYRAGNFPHMVDRFATLSRIDTRTFQEEHLDAIATICRHADRLDALKPLSVRNDVRDHCTAHQDTINLECGRFPTRIKQCSSQLIRITMAGDDGEFVGRARKIDGRKAFINVNRPVRGNRVIAVTTYGKENPTYAESTRQTITLRTLQWETDVLSNPFFRAFWLPDEQSTWPEYPDQTDQNNSYPVHLPDRLNPSQCNAVEKVLSDDDEDRIVMIQGPPGTGKTTVIAASVMSFHNAKSTRGIWVAAQSNVAVKNIAEKFLKEGFLDFKLLVSEDFYYDWHEHLYEELQARVIRSRSFGDSAVTAEREMLDCHVILCTLSMFSNPHISSLLNVVPVEMIILDEASQIECGNYLPIFQRFRPTLSKLVFVGDDKQLPPFGQDDIEELRSLFEFKHLRAGAAFLDTQYRLPHVIGDFISQSVYFGALNTHPSCSTNSRACRFVDVINGEEHKPPGHSWINKEEAKVIVKLARIYQLRRKSFRIITPYDAQRTHIEDSLKEAGLEWGDKVFNVDSSQGNEHDHIIISVVRTERPGFLQSLRRTNVMLTRCKKTMIICAKRTFLMGTGSGTLVGRLAGYIDRENWIKASEILDENNLYRVDA